MLGLLSHLSCSIGPLPMLRTGVGSEPSHGQNSGRSVPKHVQGVVFFLGRAFVGLGLVPRVLSIFV